MLTGLFLSSVILLHIITLGHSSSLLCGKINTTELGSNTGAGAALALTLVRPAGAPRACHLRVNAPEAAALAVRLIDVKVYTLSWSRVDWSTRSYGLCEAGAALFATTLTSFSTIGMSISTLGRQTTNFAEAGGSSVYSSLPVTTTVCKPVETSGNYQESLSDWERGFSDLLPAAAGRKWSTRGATHAQDTAPDQAAPVNNSTDACKLLIYLGDEKKPTWRLSLCGGNAAAVAARAGTRLLPPKVRVVWNPPTSPYQHTEKLRLVVTAVNSGAICNDDSQFICGVTSLCISSYLVCDGVRHCPGGEDEDSSACAHRRDPPLLELLRRFAARNQELLGLDQPDGITKPSVIMKISESEKSSNAFMEFAAALKPYGPWSYLVVGMLVCATILMFCLAWECCCKSTKPSDTPVTIPPSCLDLSPTVSVTAASAVFTPQPPNPPEYEPPPSYSSLFPRYFKSSPTPVPHCSHQEPPD